MKMKDKIFTVAAMATLLGIYSASIYHFSLGNIHNNLHERESVTIPSPSESVEDVQKIMSAIRTQGPARVQTNLPIPGTVCNILLDEEAEYANDEVQSCLDVLDAGQEE